MNEIVDGIEEEYTNLLCKLHEVYGMFVILHRLKEHTPKVVYEKIYKELKYENKLTKGDEKRCTLMRRM